MKKTSTTSFKPLTKKDIVNTIEFGSFIHTENVLSAVQLLKEKSNNQLKKLQEHYEEGLIDFKESANKMWGICQIIKDVDDCFPFTLAKNKSVEISLSENTEEVESIEGLRRNTIPSSVSNPKEVKK